MKEDEKDRVSYQRGIFKCGLSDPNKSKHLDVLLGNCIHLEQRARRYHSPVDPSSTHRLTSLLLATVGH